MNLIGIDCDSKKIAMVYFKSGKLESFETLISNSKDKSQKLYDLINMFDSQIKAIKPDIIYLEESIFINNFKTSQIISEVIGGMKFILSKNKIEYHTIPVCSWKKIAIGKGNSNKDQVKDFILKKYPILEGEIQDIFDACGIALAGIELEKDKLNTEEE